MVMPIEVFNPISEFYTVAGTERRIIGNSDRDEVIGRLLERTEQMADQHQGFQQTVSAFNMTLNNFGVTVSELKGAVDRLGKSIDRQDGIDHRLTVVEINQKQDSIDLRDIKKLKEKAFLYILGACMLSSVGGTGVSALLKDWFTGLFK